MSQINKDQSSHSNIGLSVIGEIFSKLRCQYLLLLASELACVGLAVYETQD